MDEHGPRSRYSLIETPNCFASALYICRGAECRRVQLTSDVGDVPVLKSNRRSKPSFLPIEGFPTPTIYRLIGCVDVTKICHALRINLKQHANLKRDIQYM